MRELKDAVKRGDVKQAEEAMSRLVALRMHIKTSLEIVEGNAREKLARKRVRA